MPCNAVAFTESRIEIMTNGELSQKAAAVVTNDAAIKLISAAMKIHSQNSPRVVANGSGIDLIWSDVVVNYNKGKLTVTARSYDRLEAEKISQKITPVIMKFLVEGAGFLLQGKIQETIKKLLPVEQTEHLRNGTVVLHVQI